ncbi:sirohydrochlorin chelatase [Prauserella cavernicola]|uniref:Sirohydrochlorin chelatase n=1 Tax=Prauserella cavernicola TaxID=2800127 RepID=A0A934QYM3_9PSEU|nr:CbiX/SirB N-terminal domain-containing protein [Prauserella cavernicola]MBK1788958.1 sirohydrochlorin chelatase [Prauserella cavernicola]
MIVLAAHGTRDPAGPRVIERLAAGVRARGVDVEVAYADVRAPDVTTVLDAVDRPAVVVPAFLASGYHVRVDIPAQVRASRNTDVVVAEAFGPAPELLDALHDRLCEAGFRPGDAVVLAAAGSSDSRALGDVAAAAHALAGRLRTPVRVGYAATATPSVADVVSDVRSDGEWAIGVETRGERVAAADSVRAGSSRLDNAVTRRVCVGSAPRDTTGANSAEANGVAANRSRVAVASWLLAPGLFQRRVAAAGADVTAEPLGAHPAIIDLVLRRYRDALRASHAA